MFRNYIVTALRSFLASPVYSAINILGLAVGLACCILILLFVKDELSYDRWLANSENIYGVNTAEIYPGRPALEIARAPGPMRQALLEDFSDIEDVTRAYVTTTSVIRENQPFSENILVADPNFMSFFGLPMAAGTAAGALGDARSVALSRRMARKFFGDGPAIGQMLTILIPEPATYQVAAIFETLPENSHMAFDIVITIDGFFTKDDGDTATPIPEQWQGAYFHTYVRLEDGARPEDLEAALPAFIDRHLPDWIAQAIDARPHEFYRFGLTAVRDIHFEGAPLAAMKPRGNIESVFAFAGIALLILIIGSINFANLTTARAASRAREIALRKTVGARRGQLIVQFLGEAVILALIALIAALGLVELALPHYSAFINKMVALNIGGDPVILLGLIGLACVTGVAAGLYPAFILSAIRPAAVLKSGGFTRPGGGRLRNGLVIFQFAIAIALITVTMGIVAQTKFTERADLGFARDDILVVRGPEGPGQDTVIQTFMDRLRAHPEVLDVAVSSAVPSDPSEANAAVLLPGAVKPVALGIHAVGVNFFQTFGVEPIAGRLFSRDRGADALGPEGEGIEARRGSAVLNQSAAARLGFASANDAIGRTMRSNDIEFTIVGVVPDMHFRSMRQAVRAEFYYASRSPGAAISVHFRGADLPTMLSFIDQTWADLVPDRKIRRGFLSETLDALYAGDRFRAALLGGFSVLAIIVSCLGLFAMASFSIQRRAREIGIRKVMGASTLDIARLMIWRFCKPVLLANLIAWPVAWWFLQNWLGEFAYRIDLTPWPFLAAGSTALLIASLTVANRTLTIARTNPAQSIRQE